MEGQRLGSDGNFRLDHIEPHQRGDDGNIDNRQLVVALATHS
jgi:hypothetical protein